MKRTPEQPADLPCEFPLRIPAAQAACRLRPRPQAAPRTGGPRLGRQAGPVPAPGGPKAARFSHPEPPCGLPSSGRMLQPPEYPAGLRTAPCWAARVNVRSWWRAHHEWRSDRRRLRARRWSTRVFGRAQKLRNSLAVCFSDGKNLPGGLSKGPSGSVTHGAFHFSAQDDRIPEITNFARVVSSAFPNQGRAARCPLCGRSRGLGPIAAGRPDREGRLATLAAACRCLSEREPAGATAGRLHPTPARATRQSMQPRVIRAP